MSNNTTHASPAAPSAKPVQSDHSILTRATIHEKAIEEHLDRIQREFRHGFEFLQKYPRSVTIFGSSMASSDSAYYRDTEELSKRIVKETGYTIISGGGPGIMEAASRGATQAGGQAVGLRINLLRERHANEYSTDGIDFTYFFARKTMLMFAAEAYVFFPGGFGTFDELFGVLTLIQTNKIPRVPVILFESSFWGPFKEYIEKSMLGGEIRTIDYADLSLFEVTDDMNHVIDLIKKSPTSDWWRNIN